jgi:plastocyanin
MKHHGFRPILIAAAATLATACGHSSRATTDNAPKAPGASTASITIAGFKFTPGPIKVRSGASVEVTNTDDAAHTLTADDGHSFDSGTVEHDKSTSVRAPRPGRYMYHCQIHSYMTGSLVVE